MKFKLLLINVTLAVIISSTLLLSGCVPKNEAERHFKNAASFMELQMFREAMIELKNGMRLSEKDKAFAEKPESSMLKSLILSFDDKGEEAALVLEGTINKHKNYWGGITKTNHAVLRFRDPIYRDPRELTMSFFHEYFLDSGRKTLLSYSRPFDLRKVFKKYNWTVSEEDLWDLSDELDGSPHLPILRRKIKLRLAGKTEIEAGKVVEWGK